MMVITIVQTTTEDCGWRRWKPHINYFDEDWFDFESLIKNENNGTRSGSAKTPYRCPICERPWSTSESSRQEYYRKSFFNNIPMERSVCQECNNALPAGAN